MGMKLLVKMLGWFLMLDGLGTILGGKTYEQRMASSLPEGPNNIPAYFAQWDETPLRLSGGFQAWIGWLILKWG